MKRQHVEQLIKGITEPLILYLINEMLEIVKQRVTTESSLHMMVEHTNTLEEAEELKQIVRDQFNCTELLLCEFNPVAAQITGPKMLGLSFYSGNA